jgi:hypothetical protein
METLAADLAKTHLHDQSESETESSAKASVQSSRAISNATVKAHPAAKDPVLADPAILYSHRKSDAFGTMLRRPIIIPPLIVMMAHNVDTGTLRLDHIHDDGVSDAAKDKTPVRGRSDRYVPSARKQADSEHSTQSSMGSDLRATAAEFVPKAAPATEAIGPTEEETNLSGFEDLPGIPKDMSMVDRNGIPFLWYMYPLEFAYQQGFRNGRAKSPKKFKPKKQRYSLSSPVDTQQPLSKVVPIVGLRSGTPLSPAATQRLSSAELMPPLPVPGRQENSQPSFRTQSSEMSDTANEPFSSQFNLIAQQAALRNRTNLYTAYHSSTSPPSLNDAAWASSPNSISSPPSRHGAAWAPSLNSTSKVDLTMIRNVGPPSGPRSMQGPTYYTVPRDHHNRHPGNGLYGGRGNAAGIRLDATLPFPNPVPPQGRPEQGQAQQMDYSTLTIGKEACGMVQIEKAMEKIGGSPCNACASDH